MKPDANWCEQITVLHNYMTGHNKLYIVRIDELGPDQFRVVGSWGAATKRMLADDPKAICSEFRTAHVMAEDLARKKIRGGYTNIIRNSYTGGLTFDECIVKIDTTRVAGRATPTVAVPTQPVLKYRPKPDDGTGRAKRAVNI